MKPRTVLYIVITVLLLVLVLINWPVIAQSTELNLIFARVQAPLGVLILLIAGSILAIGFITSSLNQLNWTRERRELSTQLEQQRLRADQMEESRIRELRETVERETAALRAQLDRMAAFLQMPVQR